MTVGTLFGHAAWDYAQGRLVPLGEAGSEGIGYRYKDHGFAVYNGRRRHENSENGKDADG